MIHTPQHQNEVPQPLFDLEGAVRVLWGKRLMIAATSLGFSAIALAYLAVTVPVYTAQAVALIDPREARATEGGNVLPGIGSDSAAVASQVSIIQSREVLEKVFDTEQIATDPELSAEGMVARLAGAFSNPEPVNPAVVFDRFASRVGVEREGLTYVINVSYKSSDPVKAARIANAIVNEYIGRLDAEKATANAEVTDLLTDRIEVLQAAVSEAERAVEDYKVRYEIFDAGVGTTLTQTRINQINDQLALAQDAERQALTAYEQARAIGISPDAIEQLTAILSSATAEALRQDYNARLAALASSQATRGPRHPAVVSQQAELSRVESSIVAEARRITDLLQAQAEAATRNVAKLESDLAQLRAASNNANQRAVEMRQLERDAHAKRLVLDQFMTRSQETGQMAGIQFSNARLISPAHPPNQPTWPRPSLLLALACALGLFVGCALAFINGSVGVRDLAAVTRPAYTAARRAEVQVGAVASPGGKRSLVPRFVTRYTALK